MRCFVYGKICLLCGSFFTLISMKAFPVFMHVTLFSWAFSQRFSLPSFLYTLVFEFKLYFISLQNDTKNRNIPFSFAKILFSPIRSFKIMPFYFFVVSLLNQNNQSFFYSKTMAKYWKKRKLCETLPTVYKNKMVS